MDSLSVVGGEDTVLDRSKKEGRGAREVTSAGLAAAAGDTEKDMRGSSGTLVVKESADENVIAEWSDFTARDSPAINPAWAWQGISDANTMNDAQNVYFRGGN
jgi:hypothetical protein